MGILPFLLMLGWISGVIGSEALSAAVAPTPQQAPSTQWLSGTYINCGGPSFKGTYVTWDADPLTSGEIFQNPNVPLHVPYATQDAPVYTTMRYWGANDGNINAYSIPVPSAGHYWVRLYFAETMLQSVQQRAFSVIMEGGMVLESFHVTAIGEAQIEEATSVNQSLIPFLMGVKAPLQLVGAAEDGSVDIFFVRGSLGDPMISALSVTLAPPTMYGLAGDSWTILGSEHRVSCGANDSYSDEVGRRWSPDRGLYSPSPPSPLSAEFDQLFSVAIGLGGNSSAGPVAQDLLPSLLSFLTRTTLNAFENVTSPSPTVPAPLPLTYTFPVSPLLPHRVRLLLLENLLPFSNARHLNLSIDGIQVAAHVDVYAAVGFCSPLPLDFDVTSTSTGEMVIEVSPGALLGYTRDAQLAGVEVFRIFSANASIQDSLLGILPPTPHRPISLVEGMGIGVGGGVGVAVLFLAALTFCVRLTLVAPLPEHKGGEEEKEEEEEEEELLSAPPAPGPTSVRGFKLAELEVATQNFSPAFMLRPALYRGTLTDGGQVTVLQVTPGALVHLSRLHHRHLLEAAGYCTEGTQAMLVYTMPPRGSLQEYLKEGGAGELRWGVRLNIARGAARGVNYLHQGAYPPVVHGDLKPSNILLDAEFEAKVANFEFGRADSMRGGEAAGDVFSFGLLLRELVRARKEEGEKADGGGEVEEEEVGSAAAKEMVGRLIERCVEDEAKDRPSMAEVVRVLEAADALLGQGAGGAVILPPMVDVSLARTPQPSYSER